MNCRYKLKDNETKEVLVAFGDDVEWFESLGYTEIGDVEQGHDGNWYLQGYAPKQPTEEVKAQALATIDNETSQAILAGFDYEVEGEALHFSYDSFDQQNFADTANVAMMGQAGIEGVPTSVTWNAYRGYTPETGGELVRLVLDAPAFLALYTQGALGHKAMQMEIGSQRKAAIAAAETVEAIKALLAEWSL